MQENIDYVIAQNAQSLDLSNVSVVNKGTFIGTKNYLFFVLSQEEEHTTREITTTTSFFDGKSIEDFILNKLNQTPNVRDFEAFMINEFSLEVPSTSIQSLNEGIEQLKVTTSWLGSGIYTNTTTRKVGWNAFVGKLGKNKKDIKLFYSNHPKIVRK